MGLGSYPAVSLLEARKKAMDARSGIAAGVDPLSARQRFVDEERLKLTIPTFAEATRQLHADLKLGFRNSKHAQQWINTMETYVLPHIGAVVVNALGPADFARCLKPIWLSKPETASRVKQRCDAVMDWCAASGFIVASPVRVVSKLLPKQPGKRERVAHQPALPWRCLPAFFSEILQEGSPVTSKAMLEFLILTAARSGEVRKMEWQEVDFGDSIWTIPPSHMKAKVAHRVPLSQRAVEILQQQKHQETGRTGLVFPSRNNTPISDVTLTKFLRERKIESDTPGRHATAHGFRSGFRDWASENGYPRDLAERALAHTISNATEAAYHRTDLLEQRRQMMIDWERFLMGGTGSRISAG